MHLLEDGAALAGAEALQVLEVAVLNLAALQNLLNVARHLPAVGKK